MAPDAPLTEAELADLAVWADAHAPTTARTELKILLAEVRRQQAVITDLTEQVNFLAAHVKALEASKRVRAALGFEP